MDRWSLPELTRARRAIVVVDVVESVRLMQEDEAGFIDRWRRFVHEVRTEVLPKHGGRMVKSLGDGMLLELDSAPRAVAAALQLQRRSCDMGLPLRIGAHVSEVVIDELDVFGAGVNLAARLTTLAHPGEFVASAALAAELVDGLDGQLFDLGPCYVKHLTEPVHAYRVGAAASRSIKTFTGGDAMRPVIAVLAPRVAADDPALRVAAELIADSVTAMLSRSTWVRMIGRRSSSVLSRPDVDSSCAAELLSADYIVAGSLAASSGRLVYSVEMQGDHGQALVCAERLTAAHADLFDPDSVLVHETVRAVHGALINAEVHRARHLPLPNLQSFSLLMGALGLMHRPLRSDFQRSGELLQHLSDQHPRAAAPLAWLALWQVIGHTRGWAQGVDVTAERCLSDSMRAIELDPDCGLAYAMAGFANCHLRQDLDSAEALYLQSLRTDPNESLAWLFKGVLHTFKGEGEAALAASETALELSPIDPMRYYYRSLAASAAVAAGRYNRAIELATESLRLNCSHSSTLRALAMAQAMAGHVEQARHSVSRLLAIEPGFTVAQFLRRSPSARFPAGQRYADALRAAGAPEH